MSAFDYELDPATGPALGLIVLQSDETIEQDFRKLMPGGVRLFFTRVPSGLEVTQDSLQEMAQTLPAAAALFPRSVKFDAIGYGCTSGTAQIGPDRIRELVQGHAKTTAVSEPVSALVAACGALGVKKVAFLSPYVAAVSSRLRDVLASNGIESPVFGSFDEPEEARVAHISGASVIAATRELTAQGGCDAVFLSCTNLRTLDVIEPLEQQLGLPVLSSNQVMAWHLAKLAGVDLRTTGTGSLFRRT